MTRRAASVRDDTALPTGTVTFLFTDIEGSTRLVQDLGDRYDDLAATHDALMRHALEESGGVEVNTEGDAFFAVFTSPQAALSATVAAQRALASADWPGGCVVRVRMGLHTGEGVLGGKDYAGIEVHRAARVAAAAHGGQVLVSEATRAMLDGGTEAGTAFRDLGLYRLKDLDRPVRLHQVLADGLTAEFPPPRARRLGTLPIPRTSFIGRRSALEELRGLLGTTRLLVLTGSGGAGKTRLALELARGAEDGLRDGASFVPLESVTDVRLVPSAILSGLGLQPGSGTPDEALREALATMQVLLVLDNVEQIPGIGLTIDDLLQAAPDLKIVATTRAALRVYGEQEYHVPSLALPPEGPASAPGSVADYEGAALFIERARSARPDFRLSEEDEPVVAEICRRLDGLPLAIELAAARTRMLPPAAILARLDRRLKLLEDHAPNLPARQRSMRGAIEWSYALLDPAEQRLLSRLGIFAGGWDLAAAEAVCDPDGELGIDVLDGIGSLLDKSLVDRQDDAPEPRFRMLQTIHEYARERLAAADELESVAERHAGHVRRLVEAAEPQFVGADPAGCVRRLAPDQDNIRAALDWTLASDRGDTGLAIGAAVWRLWQLRGQLAEGRRYLDALLELPSTQARNALRARALTAAGGVAYWQSDPTAAQRYRQALEIYEALGDEPGIAESWSDLGFSALVAQPSDPEQALGYFSESLRRYEQLGDARMVASVTGSLGFTKMALGRVDEARETLERALALNLAGGYRGRASDNRFALGNIGRLSGRLGESAAMYRSALSDAVEMKDEARTLTFLSAIASWAAQAGRHGEAIRLGSAVRRAATEQGGSLGSSLGMVDPVGVAREAGMGEEAVAAEDEAGQRLGILAAVALALALLEELPGEEVVPS
jgi:predicted ATPase/class 3 adenylate cyclase